MNESDTRLKKIDPSLKAAGWGVVEGSDIFTEQRAYLLATGTGKTYIAFQICWKLMQTRWNNLQNGKLSRILFLAGRNILANQATTLLVLLIRMLLPELPQKKSVKMAEKFQWD